VGDAVPEFPWSFSGRVRFRPAIVSTSEAEVAKGVRVLSLFGLTVGGSVCLQYDASPVGPYLEVVQMAALVFSERLWTAALWGCNLMVNSDKADNANKEVWGVPSEYRDIDFQAGGSPGVFIDNAGGLRVGDWDAMSFAAAGARPWGGLPIWWTPTLKALWFPFSARRDEDKGGTLPLRRLRLSAAALRLRWVTPGPSGDDFREPQVDPAVGGEESFVMPLPFVVEADGVLIEIGEVFDEL